MKLLVLAALAAVAVADVSELSSGYRYDPPASSYGVPQNSVTEQFFHAVPTAPPPALNLPTFEHQDFHGPLSIYNPSHGVVVTSTPAPIYSTPAPIYSTPAPSVVQPEISVVSSTPAPISYSVPNVGYNLGFSGFTTAAPSVHVGSGSLAAISPGLFNSDAALNSVSILGSTSGGSISDAFGISTPIPILSGLAGTSYSHSFQSQSHNTQVSKHLYYFAAPEEPEPPRPRVNVISSGPPTKNVRIIFIKTPSPPAPAPISVVAPPQNEEKTVVYVLVKKPEEQQEIQVQTAPPTEPSKPEVYFIRYKTPQEAEEAISHAQNNPPGAETHISADTLGGSQFLSTLGPSVVTTAQPVVSYIQSTTPTPLVNLAVSTQSPLPVFNYVQSTTPSPVVNYVSGGGSFNFVPRLEDTDISQNLISGGQIVSTTASPISLVSSGESGIIESSTIAPHSTYGPPKF